MKILQELLLIAAEYLPVWRDAAIIVLALVVIGCLRLAVEVYGS